MLCWGLGFSGPVLGTEGEKAGKPAPRDGRAHSCRRVGRMGQDLRERSIYNLVAQLPIAMLSSCKFVGGNLFLNIEPLPYSSSGAVPPTLALQPPSSKDLGWDYNGST